MLYIVGLLKSPSCWFTDRFLEDFDSVGLLGLFLLTAIHNRSRSSGRKHKTVKPEHCKDLCVQHGNQSELLKRRN